MQLFRYDSYVLVFTTSSVCCMVWLFSLIAAVILRIRTSSQTEELMEARYKIWFQDLMLDDISRSSKWVKWLHAMILFIAALMWLFGNSTEQQSLLEMTEFFGKVCVWTLAVMFFFAAAISMAGGGRSPRIMKISRSIRQQILPMCLLVAIYYAVIWLFA